LALAEQDAAMADGKKGLSQPIFKLSDLKKDWVGLSQVTTSLKIALP